MSVLTCYFAPTGRTSERLLISGRFLFAEAGLTDLDGRADA
jgi:hypothetical protein